LSGVSDRASTSYRHYRRYRITEGSEEIQTPPAMFAFGEALSFGVGILYSAHTGSLLTVPLRRP
jgi:hypothetical protein